MNVKRLQIGSQKKQITFVWEFYYEMLFLAPIAASILFQLFPKQGLNYTGIIVEQGKDTAESGKLLPKKNLHRL